MSVIPLVAVSGAECVDALRTAGFCVVARSGEAVTLTREARTVVVPDVPMVSPEVLMEILRAADLPYDEFLELLSDSPTDPAISRTRLAPSIVHR